MTVLGAFAVSLLAVFVATELLVYPPWSLDDGEGEVCMAPTFKCSGDWRSLALSISEAMRKKHEDRQRSALLEIARQEMEEAGVDVFEIPVQSSVSLERDFFQYLEEAIPEMKKHSDTKQYDEHVVKFMRYIMNRIHRDIRLLNKTIHVELVDSDGLPTGLRPVVEFLDEHMKHREDDMQLLFT